MSLNDEGKEQSDCFPRAYNGGNDTAMQDYARRGMKEGQI